MGGDVVKNSISIHIAIIFSILMLISLISLTTRVLLGSHNLTFQRPLNILYDPDVRENFTIVCPYNRTSLEKYHKLEWRITMCFNKTLLLRYNPWVRHWIWTSFEEKLKKNHDTGSIVKNETKEVIPVEGNTTVSDDGKKITRSAESSNLIHAVLTFLLVLLMIIAFFELFREKISGKPVDQTGSAISERRCSLAEFTIKRHLRKESQDCLQRQGTLEEEKVTTHGLVHQGSLDRAFSNETATVKNAMIVRQHSGPGRLMQSEPPLLKLKNRQMSMDTPDEESNNLLLRRKSRHFIRRH